MYEDRTGTGPPPPIKGGNNNNISGKIDAAIVVRGESNVVFHATRQKSLFFLLFFHQCQILALLAHERLFLCCCEFMLLYLKSPLCCFERFESFEWCFVSNQFVAEHIVSLLLNIPPMKTRRAKIINLNISSL